MAHSKVFERKRKKSAVIIRDNKGKTIDRYTAYLRATPRDEREVGGFIPMIGFNANPYSYNGFGQHTSGLPGRHLGKRIQLINLSEAAQQFVIEEFNISE